MIIGIDATSSVGPQLTGIGVYGTRIIQSLAEVAPEKRLCLYYRRHRLLRALTSRRPAANCSRRLLEEPLGLFPRKSVSLFHGLNQRLPQCPLRRAITTFHDLFVLTGQYSSTEFRHRFSSMAKEAAQRSHHIIAVSQFTAEQVVALLNYPRENISVVPYGVDPIPEFSPEQLRQFFIQYSLQQPFLLSVGVLDKRRNVCRLVEAFEGIRKECRLVLAGGGGYGFSEIQRCIQASPARHRIRHLGYVDADCLAKLYRTASALAFPSLDEGFGMPVLEAMTAGLPVVTSNRSALPELTGQAALLVDPEDPENIRSALEEVLSNPSCRQQLVQTGLERASGFTWDDAARLTLEIYGRL